MGRNPWRRAVVVAVAAVGACATYVLAQEPPSAQPALSQVRRAGLDTFTLEVELEYPLFVIRGGAG